MSPGLHARIRWEFYQLLTPVSTQSPSLRGERHRYFKAFQVAAMCSQGCQPLTETHCLPGSLWSRG